MLIPSLLCIFKSCSQVWLPWIQFVQRCNLHLHPEYLVPAYREGIMFLLKIPTYSHLAYKRISAPGKEQVWTNWMPVQGCKAVCKKECKPCYQNGRIFQPGLLCACNSSVHTAARCLWSCFCTRTQYLVHLFMYVPRSAPSEASVLLYLLCMQAWLCIPAPCQPLGIAGVTACPTWHEFLLSLTLPLGSPEFVLGNKIYFQKSCKIREGFLSWNK